MNWDFDSAVVIGTCFTFLVAGLAYFATDAATAAQFVSFIGL